MTEYFEAPCRRCDGGASLVEHLDLGLIGHADDIGFVECPRRPFKAQREAQKVVRACDDLFEHVHAQGPGFIVYEQIGGHTDRIARETFLRALSGLRLVNAVVSALPGKSGP